MHESDHRPWPLPGAPWVLAMEWRDLLFMHWPVPVAALRRYIPPGLRIDTYDGSAWLGVVPFRMTGVAPRLVPPVPWISAFAELNLRTYVTAQGKAGVWFFSLDAANPLAVELARSLFHLNYYTALMACTRQGETVHYQSQRTHRAAPAARFVGRYRPTGPVFNAAPGSLDFFLTERYCLYAANRRGRLWRGDIHHARWPLQPAEADIEQNSMAQQIGVELPRGAPLLHFVRYLKVVAWRNVLL